jgi:hypothetical protein
MISKDYTILNSPPQQEFQNNLLMLLLKMFTFHLRSFLTFYSKLLEGILEDLFEIFSNLIYSKSYSRVSNDPHVRVASAEYLSRLHVTSYSIADLV